MGHLRFVWDLSLARPLKPSRKDSGTNKAMREIKRKHDDVHWPMWLSVKGHRRIRKRVNPKIDTRLMWWWVDRSFVIQKLGQFDNHEQALKFARECGIDDQAVINPHGEAVS